MLVNGTANLLRNTVRDGNLSGGSLSVIVDNHVLSGSISAAIAPQVISNYVTLGGITAGDQTNIYRNQVYWGSLQAGVSSVVISNTLYRAGIKAGSNTLVDQNKCLNFLLMPKVYYFHCFLWLLSDRLLGSNYFDKRRPESTANRLVKRLEQLGYVVSLQQTAAPAAT